MKRLFVISLLSVVALSFKANAEPLVWDTPAGRIGLPFESTEALIGYDAVLKQAIGGFSLPVYTTPKDILHFHVGAVAPWQSNGPTVEPYLGAGHDFAREIPILADYKSVHLNVFGRYAAHQGKAGVGVSFSYSFAK